MMYQKFTKAWLVELRKVLYRAQLAGYSNPDAEIEAQPDGGHQTVYTELHWEVVDQWYGGEPFSGTLIIRYNRVVCFTMCYYGAVGEGVKREPVYACLAEALAHIDVAHPWRGPSKFRATNGLRYRNRWTGNIRQFEGRETIFAKDSSHQLYSTTYMGGIVNAE